MDVSKQSRLNYRVQNIIFILLFLSAVGLLAWLSTQHTLSSDWTAGKRNSLAEDTIKLLEQIKGPVNIRSYQADDTTLQLAVKEILERYQQHKKDLEYRLLNPDLDIEMAKADDITQYGQTIIKYNDKTERIDNLSEQNITNALLRLSRNTQPVLYFLQGHGERNPVDTSAVGYNTLSSKLQEQGFELRSLNLLKDDLSAGNSTLIIAAPSHALLPGEIDKIKQFIQADGHLLWLQDPNVPAELLSLAETLQISFVNGVVVDNNQNLRMMLGISHPAILPIISYKLHAITKQMQYFTLFTTATAMNINEDSEWQTTPLLLTQDTSWAETDGFIMDIEFNADRGDTQGPLSIGYALERTPGDQQKPQRVVVIGDSDFASNNNIGHGANLVFMQNVINWLSEDDALIAIAPKNAPDIQLDLDDTKITIIGFGFLVIIPLLLLISGFTIWYKRRNR